MVENVLTLVGGVALALLFAFVMIYKVLPAADHIVKKEMGPFEACLLTRFCAICIALPFYGFAIWMTVVVVFDGDKGISVLQEICPDDFSCTNTFALGRTNHDKEACLAANCTAEGLLARSGSQPLNFPRLGLGQDLSPVEETISYECIQVSAEGAFCERAVEKGSEEECECVAALDVEGADAELCGAFVGCDGDIEDTVHETSCTTVVAGVCIDWEVSTDSAKQFSFQSCSCDESSQNCTSFTCEVLTMEYYYPNVFYAGLITILFILPMMVITYMTIKTQLRKILKCNDMKMYVYSQEAGMQDEYTAENLATGGFTHDQVQKTKYRTFSMKDILMVVVGPLVIVFFSWCAVITAGRVGVAFVGLAASLILVVELRNYCKLLGGQQERMDERAEKNNPDPERSKF